MKRYMTILIAEEYLLSKEYASVLTFLDQALQLYRQEAWLTVVSSTLTMALKAAYMSARCGDFLKFGFEFIGYDMPGSIESKQRIQNGLIDVLNGITPTSFETNEVVTDAWQACFEQPQEHSFNIDSVIPFITVRTRFLGKEFDVSEKITLEVQVLLNAPGAFGLNSLKVIFSDDFYNEFCAVQNDTEESGDQSDFVLSSNEVKKFSFSFNANPNHAGSTLSVAEIVLTFGNKVIFKVSWPEKVLADAAEKPWYAKHHPSKREIIAFHNLIPLTSAKISAPPAEVILGFQDEVVPPPVLLPETTLLAVEESNINNNALIHVDGNWPKTGVSRKPLQLRYTLHNRTDKILPLELSIDNSENFMFSGNKQV